VVSLKYYESRPKITPKQSYINDFDAMSEQLYDNAPNYFKEGLEHEITYGEKDFETISARIDSVVDPTTGKNVGDDYKNFIFYPSAAQVYVGEMFKWNDNYWIAINTNSAGSITNACIVKRCNNVLKWVNSNGVVKEEPCSIGYNIFRPGNFTSKDYKLAQGQIMMQCQRNVYSDEITPNDRFLFGTTNNMRAYKICGDGILNYLNRYTSNNSSASVLEITLDSDFVNTQTDDVSNGVADAYNNLYSVSIDQNDITQVIGFSSNLTATVKLNGETTTSAVLWTSSDVSICTVNSSSGALECLANGSATITAMLSNNSLVSSQITITVGVSPAVSYEIRLVPNNFNVLQDDETTYTARIFENELEISKDFVFAIDNEDIPENSYKFTVIDVTSFKIENLRMYIGADLVVSCTTDVYSQNFPFKLKGAF